MSRWSAPVGLLLLAACAPAATSPAPAPPAPVPEAAAELRVAVPERPIPYPVVPPPAYREAIDAGTRTGTGRPGPAYWQNWTEYRLRARVLPDDHRVEGSASIRYHNRSPDPLQILVLDLSQNLHAPGAVRAEPAEVTGGVELRRVSVAGQDLRSDAPTGARYVVEGTKLVLVPGEPVAPGQTVDLGIDWAFAVPKAGAGERMGYDEGLVFLAYWYPQMAVYDDVNGWHPDQFLGTSEFYSGFGDYEVTLEAPAGWLVMGTGELANAQEVLAAPVLERLRVAEASDTVVRVVTAGDLDRVTRASSGTLSWTFRADSVRDVAYSLTRRALWDVARTPVGDRDGDGQVDYARVGAIYREPAFRWSEVARYEQHAIRFFSEYLDHPYPWTHMTAVEGAGIIGGGMEFPMMTLMGSYTEAGDEALYYVTAHELAHMWIPMIVATDERRYSWMDEGITTFNEAQARKDFFPGTEPELEDRRNYLGVAAAGLEGEMMRRSAYHYPGPAFAVASYFKPATVLVALRGLLGEETFNRALRELVDRWAYRHPLPWDMWNTFEDVSGQDLDWFWRSWYYETWTLDQAVQSVTSTAEGTRIVVEDHGEVPMPVRLTITREDGEVLRREIPVERWLSGARTASLTVPAGAPVTRVEIDAEDAFPDLDRANNVWTR